MNAQAADRNGPSPEVRGILWMLAAAFSFTFTDTLVKYLTQDYPVLQVLWARLTFHFIMVVLVLNVSLSRHLRTKRPGLHILRSVLLLAATACLATGLSLLPLAELSAILQLTPLLMTVLAIPILGERVGPRRLVAVAIGLAGALTIVRPGGDLWQLSALVPVGGALCFALYQLVTRLGTRTDTTMTNMIYTPMAGAIATSIAVPWVWVAPDAMGWLLLVATGVIGGVNQFLVIKAMQAAPAATVAPFIYTTLVWAIIMGYLVFDALPDAWTLLGAGLIVGSGLYVARRERQATP